MPTKLFTKDNAKEMQLKGAKNQAKSKSKNAAFKKYMKAWAESPCNNNEQRALESLGIVFDGDEILTKKAMLLIPLIKKASQGDLKAIEMILTELGENTKYELEIKKLKEENKKLKLEQKKLAIDTGDQREIEDMSTLADFLAVKPGETDDSNE
jgi:hypothetical protein